MTYYRPTLHSTHRGPAHSLKTRWLVQAMAPGRTVRWTQSIHQTERAGKNGLMRAKRKWPLSTWRIVKEEEVEWWPR